jgi:hypothetical protein
MLPASQLEKVVSAIIQTSIIIPALLTVVMFLALFIFRLTIYPNLEVLNLGFFQHFFKTIQVQSFVFLGVFWFKNNKILKMILIIIAIFVLLGVINYQYNLIITKLLTNPTFPLLPYTVAFLKYRKTEIIGS